MAAKPVPLSRAGAQVQVSFEFFPPKSAEMEANLWEAATRLEPLNPAFVSVTYGAGGSTRERTHALVERIARETTMKPAAHLTCVGASKDEIWATLRAYRSAGVRHVVALRGDPPTGFDAPYEAAPDGYHSTAELVSDARRIGDFEVSVGTYPEQHPQSPNPPSRHRNPQAEGRRRGDPGDHSVLLRQFCLFPISRCRLGGGDRRSDRAGHLSGPELQANGQFRPQGRREHPAMARRPVRGPRG